MTDESRSENDEMISVSRESYERLHDYNQQLENAVRRVITGMKEKNEIRICGDEFELCKMVLASKPS